MRNIINVYFNTRMLSLLFLGFASGIPLALIGSTLQAWMATRKVDLTIIGIFSLVGLPYTLKFLWAPLLDRFQIPFLGRRRGWMLITQVLLFITIACMAFSDPIEAPHLLAIFAFFVAFASASQDIVFDAYKTEILKENEFGAGAAVATLGYRLAMLTSGALALILSDHLPWKTIYLIMAFIYIIAIFVSWLAPEPLSKNQNPKNLKDAFIDPFIDFFKRKGAIEILLFITIYKMDVVVTLALMTPFMMELGFTKTDIGAVTKGFGLIATILGTFTGGALLARLGIYRSLWFFGIFQGISGICFYLLAKMGHNYPMMVTTIAAENFFSGMGNAAYLAFLMMLCNPKFTATQFALLSSLMALTRTVAGVPTGWLAKAVGWENYYLIAMALAIPGLLLLTRYNVWMNLNNAKK